MVLDHTPDFFSVEGHTINWEVGIIIELLEHKVLGFWEGEAITHVLNAFEELNLVEFEVGKLEEFDRKKGRRFAILQLGRLEIIFFQLENYGKKYLDNFGPNFINIVEDCVENEVAVLVIFAKVPQNEYNLFDSKDNFKPLLKVKIQRILIKELDVHLHDHL